jgi:hypothetical protein
LIRKLRSTQKASLSSAGVDSPLHASLDELRAMVVSMVITKYPVILEIVLNKVVKENKHEDNYL